MTGIAPTPAPRVRRLLASVVDLGVIGLWIGALTVAGMIVRPLLPAGPVPTSLLGTDLVVFAITVLPVWIYLTVGEAGAGQAAWGKRATGLVVVTADGGRAGAGPIALRNAVKLLPWQLAHISIARMILEVDDPVTTWGAYALSLVIGLANVLMALRDPAGRALHDRIARTQVTAGSAG